MESVMITDEEGNKQWLNAAGQLHREDGPARERADGRKEWYVNGDLHRIDGPAIEDADGTKKWFLNGKIHREDGPAIEDVNGEKKLPRLYLGSVIRRTTMHDLLKTIAIVGVCICYMVAILKWLICL